MNLIRRNKPEKTGVRAPLGDLELVVMRHVWQCGGGGCFAADVQTALAASNHILALTTVLTTLDRLHTKGILSRNKDGKAYRYCAAVSEEALQERIVAGVIGDLLARFPQAVAAYFAAPDAPVASNSETLAALAERIAAVRDAHKRGEKENG